MKIADYISKKIQMYPTLYKDVDYEKSKLKVLNYIFFTVGNGLDFAKTEHEKDGGYLTNPKYKWDSETEDSTRLPDEVYGFEKYKPIPKDYFDSDVFYVYCSDTPIQVDVNDNKDIHIRYRKDTSSEPVLLKAESKYQFSPSPINKGFCIASKVIQGEFLQADWMEGLSDLCEESLIYFNTENRYKKNLRYPSKVNIDSTICQYKKIIGSNGIDEIKRLRKLYGYEIKNELPDYNEVKPRMEKNWDRFRDNQIAFLEEAILKTKQ